jgi:L-lactate dehydrogenase complex protein LldE
LPAVRVALFVPCFVDQLRPRVARATLALLERLGVTVEFPLEQTCCGQPMANAGCERDALAAYRHFIEVFAGYEYVVAPAGSCVHHVRHHYAVLEQTTAVRKVRERTVELCDFLVRVLGVSAVDTAFPHRVGLHLGCHGLRGLRLGKSSELGPGQGTADGGPAATLLRSVRGLTLVDLDRPDECCGFGGTFAVTEPDVSARMGRDRAADHQRHGAEVIASGDVSCLLHLEGVIRRQGLGMRVMHVAEVLAGEVMK